MTVGSKPRKLGQVSLENLVLPLLVACLEAGPQQLFIIIIIIIIIISIKIDVGHDNENRFESAASSFFGLIPGFKKMVFLMVFPASPLSTRQRNPTGAPR